MSISTPNDAIPTDTAGTHATWRDVNSRSGEFLSRHLGPRPHDIDAMLGELGFASLEELADAVVPESIRFRGALDLPPGHTEEDTLRLLREIASENRVTRSFIGMGYHGTFTPAVIRRSVLQNPGWYTAYTPYQAEISQGRLEALLNFQTLITDLTGMEIANASLLDEATAAAEAMTMCHALTQKRGRETRRRFWVGDDTLPQTIDVIRTRAAPLGIEVVVAKRGDIAPDDVTCGVLLQYPGTDGSIADDAALVERTHAAGAKVVVAADLLALVLVRAPGEIGADIVVGSAQRFGVPLGFGGPHAAFFATRDEFKRSVPGRLVGVSVDAHGRPALRLALQTREQHIRREKATSNICTAQVLLAVLASFYAVYHGPEGLRRIARRVHTMTRALSAGLARLGFRTTNATFFDTLRVEVPSAADVAVRARAEAIGLRVVDDRHVGISLDETAIEADVESLWKVVSGADEVGFRCADLDADLPIGLPEELERGGEILSHPIFRTYRSETEMMRYLERLREKDVALTRSMIPLGSCTMKLNAAAEMEAITWSEFADIHPFARPDETEGYRMLIEDLESRLARITGFDAISVQPNAGSQGEYAGLLVVRRYHESRGQGHRDVCLIPSSAHGTNPASAAMAGFRVVVCACDDDGNIDIEDLRRRCAEHRENLAALMVTYPSTHGVFEEGIREIAALVHEAGGQVYMDGANLNALVGLCRPGEFGPDVAHLNLHKTFCIPHGGGGPGVGPIGVRAHLAPFLPGHVVVPLAGQTPAAGATDAARRGGGAVSAAPWGSAGILPISWSYIHLMGGEGLRLASLVAILNANYIARRLEPHYPILYRGRGGLVAHECILDLRPLKTTADIDVSDVAKRLIDYGYHAPTMSWPVAGTLMVEPTESESREELDRFCDAMISIRREIRSIEEGRWPRDDNPLRNAPHTAESIATDSWAHPYSREVAVYPRPWVRDSKYWPPVARVDNLHGDRHVVCTCPPVESWAD